MGIWEEKEGHFSRKAQHLPGKVGEVWHGATPTEHRGLEHRKALQGFEQGLHFKKVSVETVEEDWLEGGGIEDGKVLHE